MTDLTRIGTFVVAMGFLIRAKGTFGAGWSAWVDLVLGLLGVLFFFVA